MIDSASPLKDSEKRKDISSESEDEQEKKFTQIINEEYEMDLLERLTDVKERLDTKRVQNNVILPFATLIMFAVLYSYPTLVVRLMVCLFMIPSIIFNIVFISLPLYYKVYIVQKVSFNIYRLVMFTILTVYIVNLVLVFGNMTLINLNTFNIGAMYITHFIIQIFWMWLHI